MHSHSQILSLPFIPPDLREEYKVCDEFYKKMGINMYKYIIQEEIKYEKRLIHNDKDFFVFVPQVCRFSGDTVIILKENIYFYEMDDNKLKQLSVILKELFGKLYDEHGNCPFNLYIIVLSLLPFLLFNSVIYFSIALPKTPTVIIIAPASSISPKAGIISGIISAGLNTYIKEDKAFYCLGKIQSNKKIASFDDFDNPEAIKNAKNRLEKIKNLGRAINNL